MNFLSVDYEEPNQKEYRGLELRTTDDKKVQFNSGNPTVDIIDVYKYVAETPHGIAFSSSWDHFFMDGKTYISFEYEGMEYIVPAKENIKTIEELKEYYKKHKK